MLLFAFISRSEKLAASSSGCWSNKGPHGLRFIHFIQWKDVAVFLPSRRTPCQASWARRIALVRLSAKIGKLERNAGNVPP
jgi:hypothetical protein